MNAVENTASEGATDVNAFIGGKSAALVYAAPSPGLMVPSAGYTFTWTGWFGAEDVGSRIKTFRMEPEEQLRVEIQNAYDMKQVSLDMGVFFATAVA